MKKFGIKYRNGVKENIKTAIEEKLTKSPELFGERLKGTLKDLWKLRIGNYRVVFLIENGKVFVLGIWHRREAYKKLTVEDLIKRLKD